ncbi:MerR family transcriptional regulator [Streptomyces griseoluteus]|uniref:DNA polymerase III subunit beta family protein n=1 Tax=Streptomyces griseoluteus TaxID=29306 RepID=UPI0037F5B0CF
MPKSELMPIGVFAERSGLTSSALRFYADSGLLPPAEVDPVSGYRYYSAGQVVRATVLRQLREIAMPLAGVEAVLAAEGEDAVRLLDEHVAGVVEDAAGTRGKAAAIRSALGGDVPGLDVAALKGPVFADAVEQVLTATARESAMPVLAGVRVEASQEAVALTATDRYRLSTRTLVPAEASVIAWAGTVDGDELRAAAAEIRRSPSVRLEAVAHGIWLRVTGREDHYCRLLTEEFPDHRRMFASLGEVTTRVTAPKNLLLRALEEHSGDHVALHLTHRGMTVGDRTALAAAVTGLSLRISFELTTLYPAVSTSIGPDVMLDLRGDDQPVTVRSADRGDLTTLVMPVRKVS